MRSAWLGTVRLCLLGMALQAALSMLGQPQWSIALGSLPFLWGVLRLRHLHDGFSAAFWLSCICLLLSATETVPVLWRLIGGSVWGLLLPLCRWISLACFADGFWSVRLSRGLFRNRAAAAVVFLQMLLDMDAVRGMLWLWSTAVILFAAALWYYDRAARALDACDDPPTLS